MQPTRTLTITLLTSIILCTAAATQAAEPDAVILPKPVGEWEFPAEDCCRAVVGADLVKCGNTANNTAVVGQGTFSVADGLRTGDGAVRLGQRSFFKCVHGLAAATNTTPYTAVMDVYVPARAEAGRSLYRPLLQMNTANNVDSSYFLVYNGNRPQQLGLWFASKSIAWINPSVAAPDQWMRVVASWDGTRERVYVNGTPVYNGTQNRASLKAPYFYFFADNDGEDGRMDVSYCALYDRAFTDAQALALGGVKGAAAPRALPPVPAAIWTPGVTFAANPAAILIPSLFGEEEDLTASGKLTPVAGPSAATPAVRLTAGAFLRWTRAAGANAYSYVFDLKLPATSSARLVRNAAGEEIAVGADVPARHGLWSTALSRGVWHRVVVARDPSGNVTTFVDGKLSGRLQPPAAKEFLRTAVTTSLADSADVEVSYIAAYDRAFSSVDSIPLMSTPYEAVPARTLTPPELTGPASARAVITGTTYTVGCAVPGGDPVAAEIDFGNGTRALSGWLSGKKTAAFTCTYTAAVARNIVRARLLTLDGHATAWSAFTNEVKLAITAKDICLTMPYQQNVTTNAGTVMIEANCELPLLGLQYGEGYARTVAASGLLNGATYAYRARMTNLAAGASVPYRFAYGDKPIPGTEGVMKVWPATPPDSFKVAIWGDSQEGISGGDWSADPYLCASNMFLKMTTQGLAFALSTGDMASQSSYGYVKPCLLEHPCTVLGPKMPFYIAWGNHDDHSDMTRHFTEQPSLQQRGNAYYGNFYVNYGNCLFICIDDNGCSSAQTQHWLAGLLASDEARKAKFRFVLKHSPAYGEVWGSINTTLVPIMKAGNVDICFSGHMHGYERINHNGILQVTNGGMSYLDHGEKVVNNYGDDTIVGGHKPVPGRWARQSAKGVLGPAQPIRMGCFNGYGTLEIKGDTATYEAHGFNADGSYIDVLDQFTIKARTAK